MKVERVDDLEEASNAGLAKQHSGDVGMHMDDKSSVSEKADNELPTDGLKTVKEENPHPGPSVVCDRFAERQEAACTSDEVRCASSNNDGYTDCIAERRCKAKRNICAIPISTAGTHSESSVEHATLERKREIIAEPLSPSYKKVTISGYDSSRRTVLRRAGNSGGLLSLNGAIGCVAGSAQLPHSACETGTGDMRRASEKNGSRVPPACEKSGSGMIPACEKSGNGTRPAWKWKKVIIKRGSSTGSSPMVVVPRRQTSALSRCRILRRNSLRNYPMLASTSEAARCSPENLEPSKCFLSQRSLHFPLDFEQGAGSSFLQPLHKNASHVPILNGQVVRPLSRIPTGAEIHFSKFINRTSESFTKKVKVGGVNRIRGFLFRPANRACQVRSGEPVESRKAMSDTSVFPSENTAGLKIATASASNPFADSRTESGKHLKFGDYNKDKKLQVESKKPIFTVERSVGSRNEETSIFDRFLVDSSATTPGTPQPEGNVTTKHIKEDEESCCVSKIRVGSEDAVLLCSVPLYHSGDVNQPKSQDYSRAEKRTEFGEVQSLTDEELVTEQKAESTSEALHCPEYCSSSTALMDSKEIPSISKSNSPVLDEAVMADELMECDESGLPPYKFDHLYSNYPVFENAFQVPGFSNPRTKESEACRKQVQALEVFYRRKEEALFRRKEEDLRSLPVINRDAVAFLQSYGLIPSEKKCKFGHSMKLCCGPGRCAFWRDSVCIASIEVRTNTWFAGTSLSFPLVIKFIFAWCYGLTATKWCRKELGISLATAEEWNGYLREVCVHDIIRKTAKKIGGPGKIVEIEESFFQKRRWSGETKLSQQWVLGGLCRETKESFIVQIPDRSAATLVRVIRGNVLQGSTVFSNCWQRYNTEELVEAGYAQLVNAYQIANIQDLIFAEALKRAWGSRKWLYKSSMWTGQCNPHLIEFVWRYDNRKNDRFEEILRAIRNAGPRTHVVLFKKSTSTSTCPTPQYLGSVSDY